MSHPYLNGIESHDPWLNKKCGSRKEKPQDLSPGISEYLQSRDQSESKASKGKEKVCLGPEIREDQQRQRLYNGGKGSPQYKGKMEGSRAPGNSSKELL